MSKKAILVVSFGTSYEDARVSCIEPVEELIAKTYTEYEVRRAFTSRVIVKKLRNQGFHVDSEMEAVDKLFEDGFEQIYIQPLHTMPGFEYDKIKRKFESAVHEQRGKIYLGEPLIFQLEDYDLVIDALDKALFGMDGYDVDKWLLMGHGSEHFANAIYSALQLKFNLEDKPIEIATVEGFPELDDILDGLKEQNIKKIGLAPFMLVAGDHAQNDMAGDEEDSWLNVLKDNGFEVYPSVRGLGSYEVFQDLFLRKTKKLVERKR